MAKKTKQDFFLNKYYKFLTIIAAVLCLILMFVPSVRLLIEGNEVSAINSWSAIFGTELTFSFFKTAVFTFSFPALLIPVLIICGGILPMIFDNKPAAIVSAVCFAAATVLTFILPVIMMPDSLTSFIYTLSLGVGAIFLGAVSIIGAGLGAVKILVK